MQTVREMSGLDWTRRAGIGSGKIRVIDRASYLHLLVDAVVEQEVVGHAHAMGLHGVALAVVEIAHIGVVEV